jgi:hypothetical protein
MQDIISAYSSRLIPFEMLYCLWAETKTSEGNRIYERLIRSADALYEMHLNELKKRK